MHVKSIVNFDDAILEWMDESLEGRNYLKHHFFRTRNFALFNASPCTPERHEPQQRRGCGFLEGTWEATAQGDKGISANGTYTFQAELNEHVLARHSKKSNCKGPSEFDCEHSDLFYIYQDAPDQTLKAIYFDSEGHVLHYGVSTPDAGTALFITDPSQPGPQFRLVYELKGAVMSGKFQMRMSGQGEWKSYLEWSGAKR